MDIFLLGSPRPGTALSLHGNNHIAMGSLSAGSRLSSKSMLHPVALSGSLGNFPRASREGTLCRILGMGVGASCL